MILNMSEFKQTSKDILTKTGQGVVAVGGKGKDLALNAKNQIFDTLDANKDGQIDTNDIITLSLKIPGVKIDREKFLRKEFKLHYSENIVDKAIKTTPKQAGIPQEDIDKFANEVIEFERRFVSGIAAALGVPGGLAIGAAVPADIIQYYGYLLRAAQKLMYLYGFPQIVNVNDELELDTPTINALTVAMGVMFGVQGAGAALKAMATALGNGVEKKVLRKALTKGVFYPIVKNVAKWFGKNMTKEIFAGFFKQAIPAVGGILNGGITYLAFKPCCERLKKTLQDTKLVNDDYQVTNEENEILEGIFEETTEE